MTSQSSGDDMDVTHQNNKRQAESSPSSNDSDYEYDSETSHATVQSTRTEDSNFELVENRKEKRKRKKVGSPVPSPEVPENRFQLAKSANQEKGPTTHYRKKTTPDTPDSVVTAEKKPHIPPIIVKTMKTHDQLIDVLKETCANNFVTKPRHDYIKIIFTEYQDYANTKKVFTEQNFEFYTFPEYTKKPQRFVVRGLPTNTSTTAIANELTDKGYSIQNVTQLGKTIRDTQDPNTIASVVHWPLFVVTLCAIPGQPYIDPTCIQYILHCKVQVETPGAPKVIPMCFNCQLVGHKSVFCNQRPKCVRCAGPHEAKLCPNRGKPPICANCGGGHPASYRGCSYHVRIAEKYQQENTNHNNTENTEQPRNTPTSSRNWAQPEPEQNTANQTATHQHQEPHPDTQTPTSPSDAPSFAQATTSEEPRKSNEEQEQSLKNNRRTNTSRNRQQESTFPPLQRKRNQNTGNISPTNQPNFQSAPTTENSTTTNKPIRNRSNTPESSLLSNQNPNNPNNGNTENTSNNNRAETEPWWVKLFKQAADLLLSLNLHPIVNMVATTAKEMISTFFQTNNDE
jgi:hypothetical protein